MTEEVNLNCGYFAVRPSSFIKAVFNDTLSYLISGTFKIDQEAFNSVLISRKKRFSMEIRRLDRLLYATGLVFYVRKYNERWEVKPMLIHMNWSDGKEQKKQRFKSHNLWYIDDDFGSSL